MKESTRLGVVGLKVTKEWRPFRLALNELIMQIAREQRLHGPAKEKDALAAMFNMGTINGLTLVDDLMQEAEDEKPLKEGDDDGRE